VSARSVGAKRRPRPYGLAAGALAAALLVAACGGQDRSDPDGLPAVARELPGSTIAWLYGELSTPDGQGLDPETVREFFKRLGLVGPGASGVTLKLEELGPRQQSYALVDTRRRVGWDSLAGSRLFAEAWRRVHAEPEASEQFAYVDLQLLVESLREEAPARLPRAVPFERIDDALGLSSLRYLGVTATVDGEEVRALLAHGGEPVGLAAMFGSGEARADAPSHGLLPEPTAKTQLAVDAFFDRDVVLSSFVLLTANGEGGLGLAGALEAFRPLVDAITAQVGGLVSVRLDDDRFVVAATVRDVEASAGLLDRVAREGEGELWELGPMRIALDEQRSAVIAWAAGPQSASVSGGSEGEAGETGGAEDPSGRDDQAAVPALADPGGGVAFDGASVRVRVQTPSNRSRLAIRALPDGRTLEVRMHRER
jgi:hypothetical protein